MVTKSRRRLISASVRYAILSIWGVVAFFPIYWMVSTSFKDAGDVPSMFQDWRLAPI